MLDWERNQCELEREWGRTGGKEPLNSKRKAMIKQIFMIVLKMLRLNFMFSWDVCMVCVLKFKAHFRVNSSGTNRRQRPVKHSYNANNKRKWIETKIFAGKWPFLLAYGFPLILSYFFVLFFLFTSFTYLLSRRWRRFRNVCFAMGSRYGKLYIRVV